MAQAPPFAVFEAGPPLAALPADVAACLTGGPTSDCDARIIGDWATPGSFCGTPATWQTKYCACVNGAAPCPMLQGGAGGCSNEALAYRSTSQAAPGGQEYKACQGAQICVNLVEALGGGDVVSGVSQSCGAGDVAGAALRNHPLLAALLAALLLLALLAAWGGGGPGAPGPPGKGGAALGAPRGR